MSLIPGTRRYHLHLTAFPVCPPHPQADHQPRAALCDTERKDHPLTTLTPAGALDTRLRRAWQSVDAAQDHLHEVVLGNVARIVRDALPTATDLALEVNDQHHPNQPSHRVGLHAISGPVTATGQVGELWARDRQPGTVAPTYRTDEGADWPAVVAHLEHLLTQAIGTEFDGMWWEPEDLDGRTVYWCTLPTADQVAALQVDQPSPQAAYLDDDSGLREGGIWFSRPTPRPTMAVAGVAITARIADDDVFTVEIDPTRTNPTVMTPAGPGTAIRVLLTGGAMPAPIPPAPDIARDRTEHPVPDVHTQVASMSRLKDLVNRYDGDGRMRYSDSTEDGEHDNGRRAGFAATAVLAYAERTGLLSDRNDEHPATAIGDLLADLRHLTDSLGLDFAELTRRGKDHYVSERNDES